MMRLSLLLIALCPLAGCNRAPSFDERYEEQTKALHGSANSIEREVANQISGADATARAAQEVSNGSTLP